MRGRTQAYGRVRRWVERREIGSVARHLGIEGRLRSYRLQGRLEAVGLRLPSAKPVRVGVDVPPRRSGVRRCGCDSGMDALVP